MIKIIHNNKCSKSREALNVLRNSEVDFQIINYLNRELSQKELKNILEKLNISAEKIVRKKEIGFKERFLKISKDFSENDWIKMLVQNPNFIERPIIWDEKKAVIGRPTENINIFLN